jgi:hypothetical protein
MARGHQERVLLAEGAACPPLESRAEVAELGAPRDSDPWVEAEAARIRPVRRYRASAEAAGGSMR